ncbi:MAG: hypothetical protein AAGD25_29030 [Cyanobacteria bacterium P01_F01_bin.150]
MVFPKFSLIGAMLPLLLLLGLGDGALAPVESTNLLVAQANSSDHDAILAEINRLREDPAAYANWLETVRSYYDGTVLRWPGQAPIQTQEGTVALDQVITLLNQTPPLPPVMDLHDLSRAAQDHANALGQTGASVGERATTDYLQDYGLVAEGVTLINTGLDAPVAWITMVIVGDGDRQRRDLKALLQPNFKHVGIGCTTAQSRLCVTYVTSTYTETGTASSPTDSIFTAPLTQENLTALASDIIAETNQVRRNPALYAEKLKALRPYYQDNLIKMPGEPIIETEEGVAALDEAIQVLEAASPLPELEYSSGLGQAAADVAQIIGANDTIGHEGDEDELIERVSRYGQPPGGAYISENISFGPPVSAEWHIIQLLVDDDVPTRSHRDVILNSNRRLSGSSCQPHSTFRIVCVVVYASDYDE